MVIFDENRFVPEEVKVSMLRTISYIVAREQLFVVRRNAHSINLVIINM